MRGFKDWLRAFRKLVKRCHVLAIPAVFFYRVMGGYRTYARLLRAHDDQTVILCTTWHGCGDYYLCAAYLSAWLKKANSDSFVFLAPGGGEEQVLGLFSRLSGHSVRLESEERFSRLLSFSAFLGLDRCQVRNFHRQQTFPAGNIPSAELLGYNGLTMADFYLACGMGLEADAPKDTPVFSTDDKALVRRFAEHGLIPGKTVMLAPHSTGLEQFGPPMEFWADMARAFLERGYTVCTNCAGNEQAVPGTVRLTLPFRETVPFLNAAGAFIGLRSGLCDVISTAECRKVILHARQAKWWPDGRSIAYTGLGNMGLCGDAVEMELRDDNTGTVLEKVLKETQKE